MAKEVVFVADDFGMSPEINDAILYANTLGHLDAAALMLGQSATEDAVRAARLQLRLKIGWHLHLTDSLPTTVARWPWGKSPARAGWAIGLFSWARRLMREEVARQWELFQSTGLRCHFINSHHHLHSHPFIYRTLQEVVGPQFPGWIRLGRPRAFQTSTPLQLASLGSLLMERRRRLSRWRATDTLWGLDRLFHMNAAEIRAAVLTLPDGFHEFMFHPRTRFCPDTLCLLALKSV